MQNINIYTEMERHYSALAKLGALDGNYVKYLKKHAKFPIEFCHNVRMAKRQFLEQDYTPGIYAPVSVISQKICEFTQQKKATFLIHPGSGIEQAAGIGVCVPCNILTVKNMIIEAADIFLSNNFELFEPSLAETGRKHRKCDGDFSALGYFIAVWQDFYSAKWNISAAEIYISESEAVNAARKYGTNTILYPEKDTVRFLYPPDSQIA